MAAPTYDTTLGTVVGAWGLRRLVSTYSGALIRISDGIGGAQQDVGFDGSGNLATFTVSGTPYVVKFYDQSGNGSTLSVSGNVQLFLTATPRGGPACKLTGIGSGGTVIYDASPSTSRPYLTANQVWIMGVGMSLPAQGYGTIAQIPHAAGSNSSPFLRVGVALNNTNNFDFNVFAETTPTNFFPEGMNRQAGWQTFAIDYAQGKIIPGIKGARVETFSGHTISYPNSTGIYIGGSGDLVGDCGLYFCELTIINDGSAVEADLKTAIYANQSAIFTPKGTAYRLNSITNWAGTNESSWAEWAWSLTSGGADLTSPTTPVFTSDVDITNSQYAYKLVDNDTGTNFSTSNVAGNNYGIIFPAVEAVVELKLLSRTSFITVTPKTFDIEYMDNNGVWQFLQTVDLTSQGNSAGQLYTIVVDALPPDGASITSISPNTGITTGGTPVTITGALLTGSTDVQFDGVSATSIVVVDDNTITCDTPAGTLGAVDVEVFHPAGNGTLVNGFTYFAATLVSILPIAGLTAGGTAVTITGTLLTGTTDVKFDTTSATSIVVVDDNTITCVTPAHALGAVDVKAFTPTNGNPVLTAGFTYSGSQHIRATQTPLLVLDRSEQKARITQTPLLILYQEEQPNRVTQTPVQVLYTPKPVPLPKPIIPDMPLLESWGWLTVVGRAHKGQEWRSRLREVPRYKLQMNAVILDEIDRRNTYNMMMRYLKTIFIYPLFQYNTELTAAAAITATKIFCTTSRSDFRAGEFVAVFDPDLESVSYLEVSSVDSDGVNLVSPLTFAIPTYWQICPAINFRIAPTVGIVMKSIEGSFSLVMESTSPRVFQRPGAAPTLTTIDGILIVPERSLADNDVPETFNFGVVWYDNNTSVPDNLNQWNNPRVSSKLSFLFDRKTEIDYWRAIIDTMKGQQNVALFPTFRDDLPLRADIALNATVFTTNNIDFFIWWLDINYRYLMIDTANGMKYRRVISVDPHYDANGDPDYLSVTLAVSIGNTAGDNDIRRISYMNLYRLNDDSITLTHFDLETQIDLPIMAVDK